MLFSSLTLRSSCDHTALALTAARYENGDYSIATPVVSQFAAFNQIVKRFVADGAVDEINIG